MSLKQKKARGVENIAHENDSQGQETDSCAVKTNPFNQVSYKVFMSVAKEKVELHLSENNAVLDTHAGFTKEGKTEDTLFHLKLISR